jgi:hypothetical protein
MINTDSVLREREKTHGDFAHVAFVAQQIKAVMWGSPNWATMTPVQTEALEMIATKMARILCGNPGEVDHYRDIMGYAQLALPQKAGK